MGVRHLSLVGAATLFAAAEVTTGAMFFVILLNSLAYMPTLGLINTISYYRLQSAGMDIVTDFPPIRIWGTIGFIMAMWGVSFSGFELSHMQLYIGATLSVVLALFTLTLPHIPVANQQKNQSWSSMLGWMLSRCLKQAHGDFLHLLNDAGRGAADYQYVR